MVDEAEDEEVTALQALHDALCDPGLHYQYTVERCADGFRAVPNEERFFGDPGEFLGAVPSEARNALEEMF